MNILTFDIEEWFHILDNQSTRSEQQWSGYEVRINSNVDRILDMLDEFGIKSTFFCLGWVSKKHPNVLRNIYDRGHEIGCHSDDHQLVYEQGPKDFRNDLKNSLNRISDVIGSEVKFYRAPGFSITMESLWAYEIMAEHGIEVDCSIFPAKRGHGGISDFKHQEPHLIRVNGSIIKEFPINVRSILGKNIIFSGGGYFRLLPYWMIKKLMEKSSYVMTYFHPRDFDPGQPVISDLSTLRRFKSYYGLKSSYEKLKCLLSDFEFVDLSTAEKAIDWRTVRVYQI
ncbi:MAG: polysaccharide deacetylase family protein [Cyclobacteriaceae bacterium]